MLMAGAMVDVVEDTLYYHERPGSEKSFNLYVNYRGQRSQVEIFF